MRGTSITVLVALALVLGTIAPFTSARHLSVGNQDAAGVGPVETPESPSVTEDELERGLATDCFEASGDPEAAADDLAGSLEADSFCGRLVYNAGTTFVQESTPDQDIQVDGISFDVVYASYVGNYGLSTCIPWCLPGGGQGYDALHEQGQQLGISDDPDTARKGDGDQFQEYAFNVLYPNALLVAQDVTGLGEMNGWAHSMHDMQFVGFLRDAAGPIDTEALDSLVNGLIDSNQLPGDAFAGVCGFTPDGQVTIFAAQANFCEVLFTYKEDKTPDDDLGPGYNDPCDSPAYMCGALTPAWYAQLVCKSYFPTSGSFGCATGNAAGNDGPAWSDNDYDVWHFVVAPSPSGCSGAAEPGFDLDTATPLDYVAHDLDVYTPAATLAGLQQTESVGDVVVTAVDESIPAVDLGAVDETEFLPAEVYKEDAVEPNAAGDTSKSLFAIDRDGDICDQVAPSAETDETRDPWVDQIDNLMTRDLAGDVYAGAGMDLFLNGDEAQDGNNRPGPMQYFTHGFVGVFADRNDDGDYDQAGSDGAVTEIYSTGAYPMYWDLWLADDGEGNLVPEGGCSPGYGGNEAVLGQAMVDAGYGIHTGLLQVVYLTEPTYWINYDSGNVLPYLDGDTAYVFASQGMHTLLADGDTTAQAVLDQALDALPATPGNIVFPGVEDGRQTDFGDQCGEGTGGFTSNWGFLHACHAFDCSGDTIVTAYTFEVTGDGVIGGGGIPAFSPGGVDQAFPVGQNTWLDVDPIDNDPTRNTGDGAPPS